MFSFIYIRITWWFCTESLVLKFITILLSQCCFIFSYLSVFPPLLSCYFSWEFVIELNWWCFSILFPQIWNNTLKRTQESKVLLLNTFIKSRLFFKGRDDVAIEQVLAFFVHLKYEISTKDPRQDLSEISNGYSFSLSKCGKLTEAEDWPVSFLPCCLCPQSRFLDLSIFSEKKRVDKSIWFCKVLLKTHYYGRLSS